VDEIEEEERSKKKLSVMDMDMKEMENGALEHDDHQAGWREEEGVRVKIIKGEGNCRQKKLLQT